MLNSIRKIKDNLKVLQFKVSGTVKKRQLLNSDIRSKPIGIVGLGAVGLTLGVTLADLGFKVCGYDVDEKIKASIRKGKPHFFEIGLEELLQKHVGKTFSIVDDFLRENSCAVYFINVGTPLDTNNRPNLDSLVRAAEDIGRIIKSGDLVILRSTVPVGTTRRIVAPAIEETSRLKAGTDFLLAFSPERTVEGKALVDLRVLPQVVGGINDVSAKLAAEILRRVTSEVIIAENLEAAEVVKLINNTYRDLTFAFANEIALIARRWGISARKVIEAANSGYHRSSVPYPSPGVGGYCLPKDNYIFLESARMVGHEPLLFHHSRRVSDTMIDTLTEDVHKFISKHHASRNAKVFIMGFAYKGKPPTSDTRGSTTYDLIQKLKERKIHNLFGYDPMVNPEEIRRAGVTHVADPVQGLRDAHAIVVMNNNPAFQQIPIYEHFTSLKWPVLLLDTWGLYPKEKLSALTHVHYLTL